MAEAAQSQTQLEGEKLHGSGLPRYGGMKLGLR